MKKINLKIVKVEVENSLGDITKTYYKIKYRTRFLFWTWWTDYRVIVADKCGSEIGVRFRYSYIKFETREEAEFHKDTVIADSVYYKGYEIRQFLSYKYMYRHTNNPKEHHFFVNLSDHKYSKKASGYLYDVDSTLESMKRHIDFIIERRNL